MHQYTISDYLRNISGTFAYSLHGGRDESLVHTRNVSLELAQYWSYRRLGGEGRENFQLEGLHVRGVGRADEEGLQVGTEEGLGKNDGKKE